MPDADKYRERETRFLWEGPRLLVEFNGDRTQIYAYSDQNSFAPLARIDASGDTNEIYYFHNQVNGQPEAMTDREGNECWRGEPLPVRAECAGMGGSVGVELW